MTSEWKHCTIADLGDVVTGKTPSTKIAGFWDGAIHFVTPKDIQGLKHITNTERRITDAGLQKVKGSALPPNAVCVSCIGNIGYTGMTTQKCVSNQQINSIIVNSNNDPDFVYYLMRSLWPFFKNYEGQSTTLSILNKTQFSKISVTVPDKVTQKKISSVLKTIDDKISTNQKINDNLYAQARAITNQWIVENEDDYDLLPLEKIAAINPDTYSPKDQWEYINYLDTSSIIDGCISEIQYIIPAAEKLPSRARRIIAPNDVVFSTVRPNQCHFGIISMPLPNMLASTGFAVIRSANPLVCNELIYLCLTENAFIEKMQQLAEQSTSTFPSIKPSDLGVCEIPCPKDGSSSNLTEMLRDMFALVAANQRENASLSELRDSLLPKLMSGEIDVSDIQF